jgi:hypothetical protein
MSGGVVSIYGHTVLQIMNYFRNVVFANWKRK